MRNRRTRDPAVYLCLIMAREAALEGVFEPIRAPSTFEETVERLSTAIRVGLLQPGSQLPSERSLAHQLRISRSTLRLALTTLVESGYLTSSRGPAGGTFVAEQLPIVQRPRRLDVEAWAVLDYRLAIEVGAVILAAERADPEQLDRLDLLVRKMTGSHQFEYYRLVDSRFHIGVAEAAGSPRLVKAMTEVQGQMSDLISMIPHPEQVLAHANEQHGQLVELLRRGDSVGAAELMRDHVRGTEHILAALM